MQQEKNVRRVGLGQGWEASSEDKAKPDLSVRVRTGSHVVTGKMIGDMQQPRAFVWIDEAANDPKRDLVICPDLQGSWLWEDGKETSLQVAFPGNKDVLNLARRFEYWLAYPAKHWDASKPQRFFWGRFHDEGVALAKKLQALLVEEAVVRYWRPAQDPRSSSEREIQL